MREFLKVVLICAALGFGGFLWFASQLTSVDKIDRSSADMRFRAAREQFTDQTVMLRMDEGGNVVELAPTSLPMFPVIPTDLVVLAWRGPATGLVEVRIPIWFVRMKGPALEFMLKDTAFEPRRWGLDVESMQARGAGLVLDHYGRGGERVLVWTE
ncbi:hypothetical protein DRQ53_12080 [bacterium]|nr:MAG: hypothetical protein DRQ53_12080 [bacterium]